MPKERNHVSRLDRSDKILFNSCRDSGVPFVWPENGSSYDEQPHKQTQRRKDIRKLLNKQDKVDSVKFTVLKH